MEELIAYCGLKCHECKAYRATKSNDEEEIERISKEWSTEELSFTPEEIWCDGCTKRDERIFRWCKECPIRNCCLERQIPNCAHCEDFPCGVIENSSGEAKERLIALKEGL